MAKSKKPTKPRKKTRYSKAEIIDAIEQAGGIVAAAARILGCSRMTIVRRLDTCEDIRAAWEQQKETVGDEMEGRLLKICRDDNHADQFKALRFYLRTVQRSRGYGDKEQASTDKTVVIKHEIPGF